MKRYEFNERELDLLLAGLDSLNGRPFADVHRRAARNGYYPTADEVMTLQDKLELSGKTVRRPNRKKVMACWSTCALALGR